MKRWWKQIRYRFEWGGLFLLVTLVPVLPRRAVVWLANVIGTVGFYLDRRGRRIAIANLAAAFGAQFSEAQRKRVARDSYRHFGRTMCDLFWVPALCRGDYRQYLQPENFQILHDLRARGESAVLVCVHQGNFEWASLAVGLEGIPVMIVTESFKNQAVARFFKESREAAGHQIIAQAGSMVRLLKHVRRGGVAGMLADLNLRPSEAATVIEGFGMKMCVTLLHAVLAVRGGARLVPIEGIALPDGTCRVICHPPLAIAPEATYQQVAQQCWDFFEPKIRQTPETWLWAYRHWRYQPSESQREYPFYARSRDDFEALLQQTAPIVPPAPRPESQA